MRNILKSILLVFVILINQVFYCSSPNKSSTDKTAIVIHDIWMTEQIDRDGDGYFYTSKLNITMNLTKGSQEVFIRLYYRQSGSTDSEILNPYYQTENILINNQGPTDTVQIMLGLPNEEIKQGTYDLFVRIYNPISPNFVLEEATPMTYKILENYHMESEYTEALLEITDVTWIDQKDYDGDGNYSSCKLKVDFTCTEQDKSVDILVQTTPSGEETYTTIDTIKTIELADTISSKPILFDSTKWKESNIYDLKLMVMFKDNHHIEDVFDKNDDSELEGVSLESWDMEIPSDSLLTYVDETQFVDDPPYTTGNERYACYAVRFDQPQGALLCRIEEIWIHIHDANPNDSIILKVWNDEENFPNKEVKIVNPQKSVKPGEWNKYHLILDIQEYNPFYVGFRQQNLNGPSVSLDVAPPYNSQRSYKRNSSSGEWYNLNNQDIAINVLIKYYPGSGSH